MDLASLAAHLRELGGVGDRRRPGVQVALTARREGHSGLRAGLQHSECPSPKGQEQQEPPESVRLDPDKHRGEAGPAAEKDHAKPHARSPLLGADVGDAHRRYVGGSRALIAHGQVDLIDSGPLPGKHCVGSPWM